MSSQVKPMIVFESIKHELTRVEFRKLDNISDMYKINIINEISTKEINEKGFVLKAQRTLSFDPKGAFEILIEFDIICVFNQESKEYYKGNLDEISKFIEKRKVEIFNNLDVGNLMSILISQITLVNGYQSIITPPYIGSKSHE